MSDVWIPFGSQGRRSKVLALPLCNLIYKLIHQYKSQGWNITTSKVESWWVSTVQFDLLFCFMSASTSVAHHPRHQPGCLTLPRFRGYLAFPFRAHPGLDRGSNVSFQEPKTHPGLDNIGFMPINQRMPATKEGTAGCLVLWFGLCTVSDWQTNWLGWSNLFLLVVDLKLWWLVMNKPFKIHHCRPRLCGLCITWTRNLLKTSGFWVKILIDD